MTVIRVRYGWCLLMNKFSFDSWFFNGNSIKQIIIIISSATARVEPRLLSGPFAMCSYSYLSFIHSSLLAFGHPSIYNARTRNWLEIVQAQDLSYQFSHSRCTYCLMKNKLQSCRYKSKCVTFFIFTLNHNENIDYVVQLMTRFQQM